jgi:hypothetical protein
MSSTGLPQAAAHAQELAPDYQASPARNICSKPSNFENSLASDWQLATANGR